MSDFAVHHEGLPEGTGRWVLHVDAANERLLLSGDAKALYWKDMVDCTLFAVHTPSQPTMVMAVQPQQQAGLVTAQPNRMMRRNGQN